MKNTLKVDFANEQIIMDRTFAQKVTNTNSMEYAHLQQVRRDYPNFTVTTRKIKRNPDKETYKGLTYEYIHFSFGVIKTGSRFLSVPCFSFT